jgi:hypothetical protein
MIFSLPYHERIVIYVLLYIFNISLTLSQSSSLTGTVVDAASHQPVAQAIIELLEIGQRKSTDDEGRFRYEQLSSGQYTLSVRHVAYAHVEQCFVLPLSQNDSIIIILHPVLFKSGEVFFRSTLTSSVMSNIPYPVAI